MAKPKEIIGRQFNALTVLQVGPPLPCGRRRWLCVCECGERVLTAVPERQKSCGCKRGTHRLSRSYEYHVYRSMLKRCYNPNATGYCRYGGSGITVCDTWLASFENFVSDMGPRPIGHTLERLDNQIGYCPENCVWASPVSQANNRSTNRMVKYNNQVDTLANWCRKLNINYARARYRLNAGWNIDRAFEKL